MAIKVYPVTETALKTFDYEVKINGVAASLDTARVSSVPFNRRWPGHQRGIDQTELVNFLSLEADEDVYFEITPQRPFEQVHIRPQSLGIKPTITKGGTICFHISGPAHFTVEPYGRNHALHVFVNPIQDYDVDISDENVIFYGAGEHDIGEIVLNSNQTLFLDEGAVVYACVKAIDANNIKILGRGILDNSRNKERILFDVSAEYNEMAVDNAEREHTIQLEYCSNVEIEGITIRDSLVYNIRPIACKNLHINNVKIIGCWRYNSDGIDMHNCEDVLIENCFIRTFDDSICIKGFDCYYDGDVERKVHDAMYRNGKAYDIFRHVHVKNCVIWNDWGKCLEIGAETIAEEITDVVFEDCDIIHVTAPPIDCYNVDYADVHRILYQNICVEFDDHIPRCVIQNRDSESYSEPDKNFSPYLICITIQYHPEYSLGEEKRGRCRDMIFRNIHLYGNKSPKIYFQGYSEEYSVRNIFIENIYWNNELLTELNNDSLILGSYTDNICYSGSEGV